MNDRLFDLNIEKVLEDWEVFHAIREIIANALDEQALTKTREIEIFKDSKKWWHIRDYGRGLRYEHLTQNENKEKLANPDLVIGKFGVGLKDALATFNRHGIEILIKSHYGDITIIKSEKHGFKDIITLHANISPPSDPNFIGTEFILEGCSDRDISTAKSYFLKFSNDVPLEKTDYGSVLQKSGASKIYINGLKAAEEENFLFSYDITSLTLAMRKALNREKTHLGRTAYTDRVKSILLACKGKKVASLLVGDLKDFETGMMHDELKWNDVAVHASKILNESGKVVFLTPTELIEAKSMVDKAQSDGLEVVVVPDSIASRIRGVTDYSGNKMRDLGGFMTEWNQSFKFKFVKYDDLTRQERLIYDRTKDIVKLFGSMPHNVKEISISETMRMERASYSESLGLWEPALGKIIIKRSQLKTLQGYAGILLHELVHAQSGTDDVTKEFETELTALIGKLCAESIEP